MNCKPGDLAVFVGGREANIGAFVNVISFEHEESAKKGFAVWYIETEVSLINDVGHVATFGCAADADLRPIRPPEEPVKETTEQVEYAK